MKLEKPWYRAVAIFGVVFTTLASGVGCSPPDEEQIDPCEAVDCSGRGTCQLADGTPYCRCEPGHAADGLRCEAVATAGLCEENGFCWQDPIPTGRAPGVAWASTHDELWLPAQPRTMFRWRGGDLDAFPVDAERIHAMWGFGPNDIWAGGAGGALLHWDGGGSWKSWPTSTERRIAGIWGCAPDNVWAVADSGVLLHFDGTAWSRRPEVLQISYRSVFGVDCDDVWAVGSGWFSDTPPLAHWNGESWTQLDPDRLQVNAPTRLVLEGVWGAASDDLWAVGSRDGKVLRWDGATWTEWEEESLAGVDWLYAIWGGSSDDAWAVGQSGTLGHGSLCQWDGNRWQCEQSPESRPLSLAPFAGDGLVSTGASGEIFRIVDGEWRELSKRTARRILHAMDGSDEDVVWAVGSGGTILRWDGTHWARMFADEEIGVDLTDVTCGGSEGCWAVGEGEGGATIVHWDAEGTTWSVAYELPETLRFSAVWGRASTGLWGVGSGATIVHRDPEAANWGVVTDLPQIDGSIQLTSIWGSSPNDVWVTGRHHFFPSGPGVLLHWDGEAWTQETQFESVALHAVRGRSASDVWVLGTYGDEPFLRHFDGTHWHPTVPDPDVVDGWFHYTSLWVGPEAEILLGGSGQTIAWDGSSWHRLMARGMNVWGTETTTWMFREGILARYR